MEKQGNGEKLETKREQAVVVTGSSGMIGEAVVVALGKVGHSVYRYDLQEGRDILDHEQLLQTMENKDQVVHCAGIPYPDHTKRWLDFLSTNVVGTSRVANAAVTQGLARMVYVSSTSYYMAERGFQPERPMHEADRPGLDLVLPDRYGERERAAIYYSAAKVLAERVLQVYGQTKELEVVRLRFCPTSVAGVEYEWGLRLTLERAVQAIVAAVEYPEPLWNEVYNVAEQDVEAVRADRIQGIIDYGQG